MVVFETTRRFRGVVYLSVALLVYVALVVGLFPTIEQAGIDFDAYLETLPPEVRRGFVGSVTTLTTMEGYLVSQLYQTVWLLLLGVYFAYAAGRLLSSEVETGTVELLLSNPVSRTRVVVGKFLSLVPAVVFVNALSFIAVSRGVVLVGEGVDVANLALVHALSSVYLLACAGLGLVFSAVSDRARRAQSLAAGAVFGMFLLDSLTFDTDYEWLGSVAFSRYLDLGEILTEGEVAWGDLALLVAATVALVVLAAELFERRDIAG